MSGFIQCLLRNQQDGVPCEMPSETLIGQDRFCARTLKKYRTLPEFSLTRPGFFMQAARKRHLLSSRCIPAVPMNCIPPRKGNCELRHIRGSRQSPFPFGFLQAFHAAMKTGGSAEGCGCFSAK
ncbi:MAG TPA: hypothetical protein VFM56_00445 [Solimonas sp.]|nr:hypothetical protein [Solimonas sp.]